MNAVFDIFQIVLLAVAIRYVLNLFRRTRSVQMLTAIGIIVVILFLIISFVPQLDVISWVASNLLLYGAFALLIIFQPEIRQTLVSNTSNWRVLSRNSSSSEPLVAALVDVASSLSRTRTGAMVAIERQINLDIYCANGTLLNAPFVPKLLAALFFPRAPLHDGGVILRGETILAAGCVFPLSAREDIGHGMRHRAALGLSEQTDAVILVVSEETGDISIAFDGRLIEDLTPTHLTRYLKLLLPHGGLTDAVRHAIEQIETERAPVPAPPAASGGEGGTP